MRSSLVALFGAVAAVAATSILPSAPVDSDLRELYERGVIVEERDDDTSGWHDVTSGIMMERSPVPGTSLTQRNLDVQTRDGERMHVMLERDLDGGLKMPRSWEEAKGMVKRSGDQAVGHLKRHSRLGKRFAAIITWYTGGDLLNPACVQKSGWHPTDQSMVTALTINWADQPKCGQFIKIKAQSSNKSIIVRHVDACGGCAAGTKHCDLTLRAFKALADINRGKLYGLQAKVVPSPVKGKWNSHWTALYGPKDL